MLTHAENETLCRVGRDTPMGKVMRRYWHPVAASDQLPTPDSDPLRVSLLGEKLVEERRQLRPLPEIALPAYTTFTVRVRRWSTIRVVNHTYSVPARLIGERVRVHLHHDQLEVYYAGKLVERLPRLRGQRWARIDYHHVIWSLVKKPGAFARYRWREELLKFVHAISG